MSIVFSTRSKHEARENRATLLLRAARARGRDLVDLTVSNPTIAAIPYDAGAIRAALGAPEVLRYDPAPFGIESARAHAARSFSVPVDPSRVVLTASTSEAYSFLFKLLADPGDAVLVPEPSYPLFGPLAQHEGVRLVPYRLAYDGEWHIDFDSLTRRRTPRCRAIVVVSPNNPTGNYLKRDEVSRLIETGLPIVSDEVFAAYALRGAEGAGSPSIGSVLEANDARLVFALSGLSKRVGLPQMKLGFLAVGGESAEVESALSRLEHIADAFLSVSTPVQHALPELLRLGAITREAILRRVRRNHAALAEAVSRAPALTLPRVEGGWYAPLLVPRVMSDDEWLERWIAAGVWVHPGYYFDFEQEGFAVLSLLTPEDDFDRGLARLIAAVGEGLGI